MTELDDHELLAAYARTESEPAFATLVARHVNLVHSAALRFTGNPHHAGEITQAVFILLARKAGGLGRHVVVSGWLYQTARLTAANFIKGEIRRQSREQEAYMQSTLNEPADAAWQQIAPLLDEAMGGLGAADRNALVLRYFENKSAAEIATTLRLNEATAHKRVSRALEKLRKFFTKRGLTLSALTIATAVSANSVSAAPAGLATTITTVALTKGATAGASTLTLVKGALKLMAWTKAKTILITGTVLLVAAGTTTVTVHTVERHRDAAWQLGKMNGEYLNKPPYRTEILPTRSAERRPEDGTGGRYEFRDGRVLAINASVDEMVRVAYLMAGSYSECRTIWNTTVPTNHYDFFCNLPAGAKTALQQEIAKKFGLTARMETVTTNVWLLKVKYAPASLKPSVAQLSSSDEGNGQISAVKAGADVLAQQLEDTCHIPVINQTGLTNVFDYKFRWYTGRGEAPAVPDWAALSEILTRQAGLELVPATAPAEMLVVDAAK